MKDLINKLKDSSGEILRYLIVGVCTTLVSLGVYYGCVYTFLDPENPVQLQTANILSWVAAVTFAYFTNRRYVFRSENRHILQEIARFFASRLGTLFMDMAIMFIGVTLLKGNDKLIKLLVQVIVTAANYFFSKFLVFGRKI